MTGADSPDVAAVLRSIVPKQREPLPDPDCCAACFLRHRELSQREEWRNHREQLREAE